MYFGSSPDLSNGKWKWKVSFVFSVYRRNTVSFEFIYFKSLLVFLFSPCGVLLMPLKRNVCWVFSFVSIASF